VRFKQFVIEGDDARAKLEALGRECRNFIADLERPLHPDRMMFRGMRTGGPIRKLEVKRDRRALSTPPRLHYIADDWFYDKFGRRARTESLFCTGAKSQATYYGEVHAIFPVGRYKIIWSPLVKDLYLLAEQAFTEASKLVKRKYGAEDLASYQNKVMTRAGELLIHNLNNASYRGGELIPALRSHHEVMVSCDEYYAIEVGTEFWRTEFDEWLNEVDR